MKTSKDYFLQLQEQGASLYDATFTKKDAQKTGVELAQKVLDNGNVSKHEFLANMIRLSEVIGKAIETIKSEVSSEKVKVLGVEFTPTNGRKMLNYSDCPIWQQLNKDLKDREELLKLAQSQEVLDAYGNEVPKVSVSYAKDSLNIKF